MNLDEAMSELESLGTAQNRKVYRRHGAEEPLFGVSWADLRALAKRVGPNHALATALWATENYDARILATMVAEPSRMKSRELDAWAKAARAYPVADAFGANVVKHTAFAEKKMLAWRRSKQPLVAEIGWNLLAHLALDGDYAGARLEPFLAEIEAGIHAAPDRPRHAMNNALIAIGGMSDALASKAKAAAKRIGKVEVDHGETSCKTPPAIPYIDKIRLRAKAKKASKPKKKRVSNRAARR